MASRHLKSRPLPQGEFDLLWGDLLEWSSKQGYLVTGGQTAQLHYKKGVDFDGDADCPHYHKFKGDSVETFRRWRREGPISGEAAIVTGAWHRPLFYGGYQESTADDTSAYNIQTPSLFVDMRIPVIRPKCPHAKCVKDLSLDQLRLLTRQHCFAGYTRVEMEDVRRPGGGPVATRHHCIDWNSTIPRLLPNKWRVEMSESGHSFKEWCYALDSFGQSIYMERWERYEADGNGKGPVLAMRTREGTSRDRVFAVCGNHFILAINRPELPARVKAAPMPQVADQAWRTQDREVLEVLVDLCGMYGTVRNDLGAVSWIVLASTHPWREGSVVMSKPGDLVVKALPGGRSRLGHASWEGEEWDIFECSFTGPQLTDMGVRIEQPMSRL